jgi:protein TonB
MDRESKRLTRTRAAAVGVTVLLHALIIIWALLLRPLTFPATPAQLVQVVMVEKPVRLRTEAQLSALQMTQAKPVLMPIASPNVHIPIEPPPPQALASEEVSQSNASVIASSGAPSMASNGSGAAANGEGEDLTVAYRVQPIYSDASVRAREQGYVVVGLLVDEHGRVRKTVVVQSSGFRRLDKSAADALRQWSFTRAAGAPPGPAWTTIRYGFHLAASSTLGLSEINLALLSYEPELNQQVRAAAVPSIPNHAPKPRGAAALRRLITAIQTAAPTVGKNIVGAVPPVQMLVKLGAVKSIAFVGLETHGLDVNAVNQATGSSPRPSQNSQWELYEVTQTCGRSEWLLEVTLSGAISTAQALICAPDHNGATGCP